MITIEKILPFTILMVFQTGTMLSNSKAQDTSIDNSQYLIDKLEEIERVAPNRTEDLKQRAKRLEETTGDTRANKLHRDNEAIMKATEAATARLLNAYNNLEFEIILIPNSGNSVQIREQIEALNELENAALSYLQIVEKYSGAMTSSYKQLFYNQPEAVERGLAKAKLGTERCRHWGRSATYFAIPAKQLLQNYLLNSGINKEIQKNVFNRAETYEEAQLAVIKGYAASFEELEKQLPRE